MTLDLTNFDLMQPEHQRLVTAIIADAEANPLADHRPAMRHAQWLLDRAGDQAASRGTWVDRLLDAVDVDIAPETESRSLWVDVAIAATIVVLLLLALVVAR